MPFGFGRGRGKIWGGRRGKGFGPPVDCICPNCRLTMPHRPGAPCYQTKCPRCGSSMVRKFS